MLSQSSKVFLRLAGLATVMGLAYGLVTGNRDGVLLYLGLAIVATFAGVAVTVVRENEFVPASAADAPPPKTHPVSWARPVAGGLWPAMGAASVALVLCGFFVGPVAAVAGLVLGAATVVGWMTGISADHTGHHLDLTPLGLPVVGLFTIFGLMFFMSRVLLAVPEHAATITALAVPVVILGAATLLVVRPSLEKRSIIAILAVAGVVLAAGGIGAAGIGSREIHHPEGRAGEPVQIQAKGIAFVEKEIELKAELPAQISFDNQDPVADPHNVAIYADPGFTEGLYIGSAIPGGEQIDYRFEAPPAGEYVFRCDIHPAMQGKVIVIAEGSTGH